MKNQFHRDRKKSRVKEGDRPFWNHWVGDNLFGYDAEKTGLL